MYAKDTGGWNSPRGWGADVQTILDRMIKLSSVLWSPQMASGKTFPKLDPRTLPNGVKNTDWVQNVSGDVLLATDIWNYPAGEFIGDIVGFYSGLPIGFANTVDSIQSDNYPTLAYGFAKTQKGIMKQATALVIGVPRSELISENVAGLTEWFTRNPITIRYQLATPIDKLNSPFVNPLIDLKGRVGKNIINAVQGILVNVSAIATIIGASIKIVGSGATYRYSTMEYSVPPNTICTFKVGGVTVASGSALINPRTVGGVSLGDMNAGNNYTLTFTTPSDGKIVVRYFSNEAPATSGDVTYGNIQLELGSVATTYEPYGKANLLLKNFAGTQASGFVDVPCITGRGQAINFKNLLGVDGNFGVDSNADGLADGWSSGGTVGRSVSGGVQKYTPNGQYGTASHVLPYTIGDIIYGCAYVLSNLTTTYLAVQDMDGTPNGKQNHSGNGQFEFLSAELTPIAGQVGLSLNISSSATSGWTEIQVKQAHSFNKTLMFPDPLTRPNKAKMDELVQTCIKKYGYVNEQTIMIEWVPMLKFDGATSYGMANHPSLDIVGQSDFAIATVFKTGATQINECLVSRSNGGFQYLLYLPGAALNLFLNANEYSLFTTMKVNTLYKCLVYRKSGVLKCRVMDVETYNSPNVINVITKDNFRVGNYSLNAGGTNHAAYTNIALGHLSIINGAITPFTEADLIAKWDKYCAKTFGI